MTSESPEEAERGSAFGNFLSGNWELSQKILENLSYLEVLKLRMVCRTWAGAGMKILAEKRRPHYLTIHQCIDTTHGKVAIGDTAPDRVFEDLFMDIVSRPRYCLSFCSANWLDREDIFHHPGKNVAINLPEYLREKLPSSCDLGVVSATGIIGTVEASFQGHWLKCAQNMNQEVLNFLEGMDTPQCQPSKRARMEEKTEKDEVTSKAWQAPSYSIEVEETLSDMEGAVTLMLIPYHPGVKMTFFEVSPQKFYSDFRKGKIPDKLVMSDEEFNEVVLLSPDEHLASLLIFDTCQDEDFTNGFIKAALNRENYQVALGGGVAEAFQSSRKLTSTTDQIFGVAVSGPNIMAASVLIPSKENNPAMLPKYMNLLKSCGLPEKQSVAFMFTCCGRGYNYWRPVKGIRSYNVESKAFRAAFPQTPIFGFFGRGEIGITYLPKFQERKNAPLKKETVKKRRSVHQYSTIIVLLSFL